MFKAIVHALMAIQFKILFIINFLADDFYFGNLRNYKLTHRLSKNMEFF